MEYEMKVTKKFILDENEIRAIKSLIGKTSINSRVRLGMAERDSEMLSYLFVEIREALVAVK